MKRLLLGLWLALIPALACAQDVSNPLFYVTGAWTPTVTTDATAGTPAYSIRIGTYERIGRNVRARFTISLSGWTGSPTGNVIITGLPVASANTANDFAGCFVSFYAVTGLAASSFGLIGSITANTSQIAINQNNTATVAALTAAQAGTTLFLIGSCDYHT